MLLAEPSLMITATDAQSPCLDAARRGQAQLARPVDAERGAEALRPRPRYGPELRAAPGERRRLVAAHVVDARRQADQRRRAHAATGPRGRRRRDEQGGRGQEAEGRRQRTSRTRSHFYPCLGLGALLPGLEAEAESETRFSSTRAAWLSASCVSCCSHLFLACFRYVSRSYSMLSLGPNPFYGKSQAHRQTRAELQGQWLLQGPRPGADETQGCSWARRMSC